MPTLKDNKRTMHKYTVIESWDAGIVLTGPEVKSAKAGRIDLSGSYATFEQNELWLVNCHIAPYAPAKSAQRDYDPRRRRKLLLTRKELDSLFGKAGPRGLTLTPLRVYTAGSLVKVAVALVRGKSLRDKRADIKKRDVDRKIRQAKRRR